MLSPVDAVAAVQAIVAFAVVLFLLRRHAALSTEVFRQRVFELRRKLLVDAYDKGVPFDGLAYRMTEAQFNRAIRYAERLSFSRALIAKRFTASSDVAVVERFVAEIKRLPPEQQVVFAEALREFRKAVTAHFFKTSPLLWAIVVPWSMVLLARHHARPLVQIGDAIVRGTQAAGRALDRAVGVAPSSW